MFYLRKWTDEVQSTAGTRREPSLLRALYRIFGWKYILFNVILIIEVCTLRTNSMTQVTNSFSKQNDQSGVQSGPDKI